MKNYIKSLDHCSKLVKIIFALPFLDIIWAIYRICKSAVKKNTLGVIIAVIMIFVCAVAFWIIDIITIILSGKVLWID